MLFKYSSKFFSSYSVQSLIIRKILSANTKGRNVIISLKYFYCQLKYQKFRGSMNGIIFSILRRGEITILVIVHFSIFSV